MPPPVRGIRVASGKKFAVDAANIKALQVRFAEIVNAAEGEDRTRFVAAKNYIGEAFASVARLIRDKARTNLASSRYPKVTRRLDRAIFAFTDPSRPKDRNRRSALVGIRTGAPPRKDSFIYAVWGVGSRRRKDGSVAVNGLGVSFAHIFNRGTLSRKIKPTRFFHNALYQTKAAAVQIIKNAYNRAVNSVNSTP